MGGERKVYYLQRSYREGDIKGYFIAFAATGIADRHFVACEANRESVL